MSDGYSQRDLIKFNFESLNLESNEFFGNSPPSVFVGRFGYPQVNVGVLSPVQTMKDAHLLDSPQDWIKLGLKDEDILKLRAKLVNSRFKSSIKNFDHKFLNQDVAFFKDHQPTAEWISVWIFDELKNKFPEFVKLKQVSVYETPELKVSYQGQI